ncbi:hypothetical protein GAMM_40014 [Gammaproteobacteria bacterium]
MAATALAFDTLAYVKKLVFVGVPEKQAEVQAETLASLVNDNIATKRDIRESEASTKQDIKELELTTTKEIELIRRDIEFIKRDIELIKRDMSTKTDIELIKRDIIIKLTAILGSMTIGCFTILGTLIVFLR